jgi:hypothetical protein
MIVFITAELWIPIEAFNSEDECYAYLNKWELFENVKATCLPATVEEEHVSRRHRRRSR